MTAETPKSCDPKREDLRLEERKLKWDIRKGRVEVLAFVAAALFFGYKIAAGWFWPAISLDIEAERHLSGTSLTNDILVVRADVENKSSSSFHLLDSTVKVHGVGETKFAGMKRYETGEDWRELDASRVSQKHPHAGLGPGQRNSFAAVIEVPQDAVCVVDVTILGKNALLQFGRLERSRIFQQLILRRCTSQVKSSVVSPPNGADSE